MSEVCLSLCRALRKAAVLLAFPKVTKIEPSTDSSFPKIPQKLFKIPEIPPQPTPRHPLAPPHLRPNAHCSYIGRETVRADRSWITVPARSPWLFDIRIIPRPGQLQTSASSEFIAVRTPFPVRRRVHWGLIHRRSSRRRASSIRVRRCSSVAHLLITGEIMIYLCETLRTFVFFCAQSQKKPHARSSNPKTLRQIFSATPAFPRSPVIFA